MTTTPAAGGPPPPAAAPHLSDLLRRPIAGRGGESIGRLSDVIVRLRGADQPVVTGLVAAVGGRTVFVPIEQVASLEDPGRPGDQLRLTSAKLDLRRFDRRGGEVLLRADVLRHRLIDVANAHLIRAGDLELAAAARPGSSPAWTATAGAAARCPGAPRTSSARGPSSSR